MKGTGPGASAKASAPQGVRELTYEPVGDDGLPLIDAPMSASLAGAKEIDGPLGKTLVVERHYAPADWHGSLQLRDARVTPDDVALIARDPAAADAPRARILYLDLETTGLSGGAGTVAFLVGCALSREDGSFLIRQFVLPSFAAERALIGAVSEWARAEAAVLVTYNGRTFDVPVMETRWAFHRLRSPWDELPHLDMLHVARRLWSKKHARDPERGAVGRAARGRGQRLPSRRSSSARCSRSSASATCPASRSPGAISTSCAAATGRCSSRCCTTTGSICCRSPASPRARRGCCAPASRPARAPRKRRCSAASCTAGPSRPRPRPATAAAWTTSPPRIRCAARRWPAWRGCCAASAATTRRRRAGRRSPALRGLRAGLRLEATEALAVHFEHRRRDLERAHSYAERARHADMARPGLVRGWAHRGHPPGSAAGPVATEAVWSPSRERGRRGLAGTGAVLEGRA